MSAGLTAEELAYMRETQAEHRPTPAELLRAITVRTPTGGATEAWAEPEPVDVRIDGNPEEVPQVLADRWEGGTLVALSMDLVHDVRDKDRVRVSLTEVYEVVSEGDPDRWATAQTIYARRISRPPR